MKKHDETDEKEETTQTQSKNDVLRKLDQAGNNEEKAAQLGLPHGPERGKYDAHETDVLDAKARDQRRVLRDQNQPTEGDSDGPTEGNQK